MRGHWFALQVNQWVFTKKKTEKIELVARHGICHAIPQSCVFQQEASFQLREWLNEVVPALASYHAPCRTVRIQNGLQVLFAGTVVAQDGLDVHIGNFGQLGSIFQVWSLTIFLRSNIMAFEAVLINASIFFSPPNCPVSFLSISVFYHQNYNKNLNTSKTRFYKLPAAIFPIFIFSKNNKSLNFMVKLIFLIIWILWKLNFFFEKKNNQKALQ